VPHIYYSIRNAKILSPPGKSLDLRFTLGEARELFAAAGVELPKSALEMLHERTEGWAAGLRLPGGPRPPLEPLSQSEIRVLRYLPTNLSAPEIANELYVTANTVRTHVRHLYAKLGTHYRAEAVEHARALGLLTPSAHRP
jgi:ATP/maltotriose-dependent transcriptional regulator MalT